MFALFKRKSVAPATQEVARSGEFLDGCDFNRSHVVFSPDRSDRRVSLPYPNIQEWSRYLKRVVDSLKSEKQLPVYWGDAMARDRWLRDFFVDETGYYLDPRVELERWYQHCKEICAHVDRLNQTQSSDTTHATLRTISPLVSQMRVFIDACDIKRESDPAPVSAVRRR